MKLFGKHSYVLLAVFFILVMVNPLAASGQDTSQNQPNNRPNVEEVSVGEDSATSVGSIENAKSDTVKAAGAENENSSTASTSTTDSKSDSSAAITEVISIRKVVMAALLLIFTFFLNRLVIRILENMAERSVNYRLSIKRLVPAVRIIIWGFALYIVLEGIIDPPMETVITILASAGIAVGFAAQDILKNIFGGFMIILDRPFQVGDKIKVGEHYGEVLQVGLRSSRIVSPDDSVITIPNAELMTREVSNANSSALDCQVVAEIYLPAHTDIDTAKRIAYRAAISSKYIFLKKPVVVITANEIHQSQYVIKMRVKAYVLDIRYEFPFKSDMTERILSELNRRNMLPVNG